MININISDFKKNINDFINQIVKYNQPVSINTKLGNVVLLSEEDFNNINVTIELINNTEMKNKIIEGLNTPVSECIPENKVEW